VDENENTLSEELVLATLASRIYGTIAVQTCAHSKSGEARSGAIATACEESVTVAARILQHARQLLAQRTVAEMTGGGAQLPPQGGFNRGRGNQVDGRFSPNPPIAPRGA